MQPLEGTRQAQARDTVRGQSSDFCACEGNGACRRALKTAQHVDQCGLSGSIGTDYPEKLSLLEGEIDPIQSLYT
jgi:hypothetical protein